MNTEPPSITDHISLVRFLRSLSDVELCGTFWLGVDGEGSKGEGSCTGGLESRGGFGRADGAGLGGGIGDGEGTKESDGEAAGDSGGNDVDADGGNEIDEIGESEGECEGENIDGNGEFEGDAEGEGNGDDLESLLFCLLLLALGEFGAICSSLRCATFPSRSVLQALALLLQLASKAALVR